MVFEANEFHKAEYDYPGFFNLSIMKECLASHHRKKIDIAVYTEHVNSVYFIYFLLKKCVVLRNNNKDCTAGKTQKTLNSRVVPEHST